MQLKSVNILKPSGEAFFELGAKIMYGEKETDKVVKKIEVDFMGTVKISLSDGTSIYFERCAINYEK